MNTPDEAGARTRAELDPVALGRLRELDPDGRMGVVARVLATFETSLTRMVAQLRVELERPQRDVVAAVAHQIKSSSAAVGALDLSRACAEVEAAIREDGQRDVTGDVQRLLVEAERALAAVAAMLRT
jgi:HPt (histidine-containing phosphotransfer) domain-containing protein